MLDQLVESRNTRGENTRRSGFFLTTFILMVSILLGGWVYSLFAKDYGLGSGDLELSELVKRPLNRLMRLELYKTRLNLPAKVSELL
ncbi:MAG: hypothetical protein LC768_02200 [Acidobacteria bacterium]|nr:hypothetical protein [Acidobacteriota bacterium]